MASRAIFYAIFCHPELTPKKSVMGRKQQIAHVLCKLWPRHGFRYAIWVRGFSLLGITFVIWTSFVYWVLHFSLTFLGQPCKVILLGWLTVRCYKLRKITVLLVLYEYLSWGYLLWQIFLNCWVGLSLFEPQLESYDINS